MTVLKKLKIKTRKFFFKRKLKRNLFYNEIYEVFNRRGRGKLSVETIEDFSRYSTKLFLDVYQQRVKENPRTKQRFSNLKIEDLDSVYYQRYIFDYCMDKYSTRIMEICPILFNMSKEQFLFFKEQKEDFDNM